MEEGVLKYGKHDGEQYGTRRVHRGRESNSRVTNKTRKAEKIRVSTRPAARIEPVDEEPAQRESSSDDASDEEGAASPDDGLDRSHLHSPEPWDAEEDGLEAREAVLFSTNGREHAFFTPQGDPVSFRDALTRADATEWTEAALSELTAGASAQRHLDRG